jgi:broad specificity phosphatase PhoE
MNPSPALPQLYLLRHGETDWSLSGQHTSRTEVPLNAQGEDQARRLGLRLNGVTFARILTSPRIRARRTGELAGFATLAQVDPDLSEWDYGDYEGRKTAEITATRANWDLFTEGCPGGESPAEIARRADRVIRGLRAQGGNIAIFSHGHFLRVLTARWIELPVSAARHFVLGTASLSTLGFEHDRPDAPAILSWNERG